MTLTKKNGLMICLMIYLIVMSHIFQTLFPWIFGFGYQHGQKINTVPHFNGQTLKDHLWLRIANMSRNKSPHRNAWFCNPSRPSKCPKSPTARRRSCADPPHWTPRKLAAKPPGLGRKKSGRKTSKNHGFVGFQQQKRSNMLGLTNKTWGLKLVISEMVICSLKQSLCIWEIVIGKLRMWQTQMS